MLDPSTLSTFLIVLSMTFVVGGAVYSQHLVNAEEARAEAKRSRNRKGKMSYLN